MNGVPPSEATDAVLVPSDPVPEDARQVKGIDWAALPDEQRAILADFVHNLSGQGFQSSSIGEAIDIINDMVCSRTPTDSTHAPF
jgi:deoxyhypusine synthase